ncbi:MAG: tetratricopeptide repeat protein [Acidobacteria bacterium]|nr:tetratricopeptide repeat protein [Acidobacteriota bacterium]
MTWTATNAGVNLVPVALTAFLTVTAAFGQTLPALEPVEEPRIDHYEQVVQDQLVAARRTLERLLEAIEPDRDDLAAAFGHLGQLYLLYDFMAPAAAALRNAEALDATDIRWPYYGAIHDASIGDYERAFAGFDRVLAMNADHLAALVRRGDVLLELDRFDAAEADYRRVLNLDPAHSAALFGLGRVDYGRGELERAVDRFQAALPGQPAGTVIHHHIGRALRRLGRRDEAEAALARNEHVEVGFPDPLYRELQRLNVSRWAFFLRRGTEAMEAGDPRTALQAFGAALEASPNDPLALFNMAMAMVELGNKAAAADLMRQAIAADEDFRDPHYNLALVLAEEGNLEAAERHFRRAAEIDPVDLEARVKRADVLTRLARTDQAIELLKEVLETDPALPMANLTLGAAHQAAGDVEAAVEALLRVLEAAPGAPRQRADAHFRLALIAQAGRAEQATPTTSPVSEDAAFHLQQAIAIDPDFAAAHALLGNLLGQQERYVEAASHYARALARDPTNPGWHAGRAMALILGRRHKAAHSALRSGRRAVASGGADTAAIDHLDTLLARLLSASPDPSVRNGAEALAIAQRLMGAQPTLDRAETLAMALAETGDFERAAELQQQVLSEVERRGASSTAGQRQRLSAYRNGEPAREPWFSP